jgi:hypothetical protein
MESTLRPALSVSASAQPYAPADLLPPRSNRFGAGGPPDSLFLLSVDFLVKGVHDVVELVHFGVNLLVDGVDFFVERVELLVQRDQFLVLSGHDNPHRAMVLQVFNAR